MESVHSLRSSQQSFNSSSRWSRGRRGIVDTFATPLVSSIGTVFSSRRSPPSSSSIIYSLSGAGSSQTPLCKEEQKPQSPELESLPTTAEEDDRVQLQTRSSSGTSTSNMDDLEHVAEDCLAKHSYDPFLLAQPLPPWPLPVSSSSPEQFPQASNSCYPSSSAKKPPAKPTSASVSDFGGVTGPRRRGRDIKLSSRPARASNPIVRSNLRRSHSAGGLPPASLRLATTQRTKGSPVAGNSFARQASPEMEIRDRRWLQCVDSRYVLALERELIRLRTENMRLRQDSSIPRPTTPSASLRAVNVPQRRPASAGSALVR